MIDDRTRSSALLVSSVLFRSFAIGIAVLILGSVALVVLLEPVYDLHRIFFETPRPEFSAILLTGLLQMRMLLFVFFLFPAIAIRWALKTA